ncbi:unnamed protein product [Heligmosomoides polygyrus]|uniref:Uncharacterized protein n=1 Tax=Heligmosomoides polygyrus TaxID=6339 RepID=A0A183F288_HELPZ|nr:unnamed protein product [Heligmosomoides polygyrus]
MPLRPGLPRVDNRAVVCPNRRRRLSRGVMLATIESSPLMPGDGSIRWRNLNDMASSKVNRSSTSSQPQSSASRRLLGGQKHSRSDMQKRVSLRCREKRLRLPNTPGMRQALDYCGM